MHISRRMIAATALLLAGGAAAVAAVPAATAAMGWERPAMAMQAGGHGRHEFGPRGGMGRGPGMCSPERSGRIDDAIGLVESFVTFRPEQQEPWAKLRDAVKAASARLDVACEANRAEGPPDDLPGRLERMERMVTAEAQSLQEVRPALDAFYATLDAQQKAALQKVLPMGRPHRG